MINRTNLSLFLIVLMSAFSANLDIRAIFEDSKGNIWLGDDGYGVFVYDGDTTTHFLIMTKKTRPVFLLLTALLLIACTSQSPTGVGKTNPPALEDKKISFNKGVSCGIMDSKGVLWFGSSGAGVYRYENGTFSHFTAEDGLCDNQIYSIIEDQEGALWFGTTNGLCQYDGETFTHVPIPFSDTSSLWLDKVYPIINPNAVHALAQDRQGNIWIGTGGGGAYRYDPTAAENPFTSFLTDIGWKQIDSLYHNWIPDIAEDAAGNMWFASMTHGGASRFDGNSFTHFMPKDGLSDDMIRTIFKDKSGKLWFGFNGNRKSALTSYDGKSFTIFREKDGLCGKRIHKIHEDPKGNLWLGGFNNLCIYNPSEGLNQGSQAFHEFESETGQKFDRVMCILEDAAGDIWFGGMHGLWKFDGKAVHDMTHFTGKEEKN